MIKSREQNGSVVFQPLEHRWLVTPYLWEVAFFKSITYSVTDIVDTNPGSKQSVRPVPELVFGVFWLIQILYLRGIIIWNGGPADRKVVGQNRSGVVLCRQEFNPDRPLSTGLVSEIRVSKGVVMRWLRSIDVEIGRCV